MQLQKNIRDIRDIRVLVVDDNRINCQVISLLLEVLGITEVTSVNTGNEGIDKFLSKEFDMVFLDINLTDSRGTEICRQMRKNKKPKRRIPIIAYTSSCYEDIWKECELSGMDAFLPKPIRLDSLKEVVSKFIEVDVEVRD